MTQQLPIKQHREVRQDVTDPSNVHTHAHTSQQGVLIASYDQQYCLFHHSWIVAGNRLLHIDADQINFNACLRPTSR